MKKKFISSALIICLAFTCLLITGCTGTPNKYYISVNALHYNLGSIEGGNNTYTEGDTITIKAIPSQNSSYNSTFYCWLLNNKVVSTQAEYTFTVSKNTSGNYLALFTCPYLEYFSLSSISLDSGILDTDSTTFVKKIEIFAGEVENSLETIYEITSDTFDKQILLDKNTIHELDNKPYTFDIQNDLFLKINITYEQNEIEFISETNAKIEKNDDVTQSTFSLLEKVLSEAINLENEDLKLNLNGNNAKINLVFERLTEFDFDDNQTEE